ncbi:MAG TPA: DUF2062 domain-containing protein [Aurantimonas coralicida]|uniref:DUF2062 domain-containing protein n=2 Tax=root TaxID=1 RepID=A0A9C9TJ32_9HYPH|nr:DUF2062 domain-containing protein [Aurantimonas coralicida]HEU02416.1 DUF2062 domain-containing protein [Aurantimonas coralicida]
MLFGRRHPEKFGSKLRTLLWPRRSFSRSFRYLQKRVLRLNATPHAIAAGFAAGVFSSFTPFIGFHFLLAFALAYVVAGNMASAALGTAVGNPLSFPFIWGATYEIGQFFLTSRTIDGTAPSGIGRALTHMDFASIWTPIVKPMLVGGIPLGTAAGLLAYGLVFAAARSFQKHRMRRILEGRPPASPLRGAEKAQRSVTAGGSLRTSDEV